MTKLKLIVSSALPFAGTNYDSFEDIIKKAQKSGHTVCTMSGAYLHGKLRSAMGYDICACLNAEECVKDEQYISGIYDVEVIGYPNLCKAYLWNSSERPRGLIVDPSDAHFVEDAIKKYNSKEELL